MCGDAPPARGNQIRKVFNESIKPPKLVKKEEKKTIQTSHTTTSAAEMCLKFRYDLNAGRSASNQRLQRAAEATAKIIESTANMKVSLVANISAKPTPARRHQLMDRVWR